MSSLVEFQVSSLWALKPCLVREIVAQLNAAAIEQGQYLFDSRRNWFQITCQQKDEMRIKRKLKQWLEDFEENVLDEDPEVVDDDGALVKPLDDNAWLGIWDEDAILEAAFFTDLRLPDGIKKHPHTEVWEAPSPGTLEDFMTRRQFQELQKQRDFIMATNLSLTEVYIGAMSQEEVELAISKLDTLSKLKEVSPSQPVHLLWTEAYQERPDFTMTFDTRFLANIDSAFIAATYLDVGQWIDTVDGYKMLAEAITVRLCRYDQDRGYYTSLIGPKLKARGNPPLNINKRRYKARDRGGAQIYGATMGSNDSSVISLESTSADSLYETGDVQKWFDDLEALYGIAVSANKQASNAGSGTAGESHSALNGNNLSLSDVPVASCAVAHKEVGRIQPHSQSLLDVDDSFIVPETVTASYTGSSKPCSGNDTVLSSTKARGSDQALVDISTQSQKSGRAGSAQASSRRNPSKASTAAYTSTSKKLTARPETAAAQFPSTFMHDLRYVVGLMLARGPYLRGKVDLRVDLGRILLTGMDFTALAFNGPGSRSNGWHKGTLLRLLNNGSRAGTGHSVTFTKMLTQDGDDVVFMLTPTDIPTGQQLWRTESTIRVVYSFLCVSQGQSFLMDVEVDKSGSKFKYSFRTKQDDSAPLWIHCTLRSWDARITMSHVDTEALEAQYGAFARSFVESFAVTLPLADLPQIHMGVHRSFDVTVKSMRINTHFRFVSADEKSYLDITEVEETVFMPVSIPPAGVKPASLDEWMFCVVIPKRHSSDIGESEERGLPTFWYEASIRSVAAEKEMAINQSMGLGERARWNLTRMCEQDGDIDAIIKSALRMVQTMDSVGAHNDNHQAAELTLPRENTQEVPGTNYVTKRGSSASTRSLSRARIPLNSPAPLVQMDGPPGVVVARASSRDRLTPPTTAPTPNGPPAPRMAAPGASPAEKRAETMAAAPGNNQNIIRAFAPGAANGDTGAGAGAGFGVAAPRASSRARPQGRRDPSSAGSDASRGHVTSYKPSNAFW